MNAMTNFTLCSLRANKVRTLVTIAGVALAAALLTAVLTSYTSLTNFLYRVEANQSGTWMACVETDKTINPSLQQDIQNAIDAPDITGLATMQDVGFGELTENQQSKLGFYAPIASIAGDFEDLLAIHASEGRIPEKQGEILLYKGWKEFEGVQVGDTLTLEVGQREAILAKGKSGSMSYGSMPVGSNYSKEPVESVIEQGTLLNSSYGVMNADEDGGIFNEHLIDKKKQSYTVVGFYDNLPYALSSSAGPICLTVGNQDYSDFTSVYLSMNGVSTSKDVEKRASELFPNENVLLHSSMLRYMGIVSEGSIWETFFGLVAVLAIVISIACVSLIFNAFNISVAERVSQFGLLSSVGASRKQLRRAVMLEGMIVALVGIPLGLLIGIDGCAVTFSLLGPSISKLAANSVVPFGLAPSWWGIAIAAVLTLVTVFVSVWIPSKRASRLNIIDALRHMTSSRASKKGARDAMRSTNAKTLWSLKRGIAGRIFGIGGTLARINRKRGTTKGHAASISLALAIVLLMTAGSLNVFLGGLVDAVVGQEPNVGEVNMTTELIPKPGSLTKKATNDGSEKLTPQSLLVAEREIFAAQEAEYANAYDELQSIPNAKGKGWNLSCDVVLSLPKAMAGSALKSGESIYAGRLDDGNYGAAAIIVYLEDSAFNAFAESVGQDPSNYRNAGNASAIGIGRAYGNNGDVYQLLDILNDSGTVKVAAASVYKHEKPAVLTATYSLDSTGEFGFQPMITSSSSDYDEEVSSNDVDTIWESIDVLAITENPSTEFNSSNGYMRLVMPMSEASKHKFGISDPIFKAYFDSLDGDHVALCEEIASKGNKAFANDEFDVSFYSYYDYVEQAESTRMVATIVNVFCLLFTVILALIAMANVFNTVTNSLILRRREFAVMKSIGLSNKQFHRMIIDECTSFGIVGLIPGLVISVGVSYLMYKMVLQSLSGLPFTLPWLYMLIAIGMTAAAMGISVAYGKHRCKADNVVEALRADSV